MDLDTDRFGTRGYGNTRGDRLKLEATAHRLLPGEFTSVCGAEMDYLHPMREYESYEKKCRRCAKVIDKSK